jgi:hypothetical protein
MKVYLIIVLKKSSVRNTGNMNQWIVSKFITIRINKLDFF